MHFIISSEFQLFEPDTLSKISALNTNFLLTDNKYIEVLYESGSSNKHIVSKMINAIIAAQLADVPVIFNRTNIAIANKEFPTAFCVGLFTSGTTGLPKLVFHKMANLLPPNSKRSGISRWLLCYHPMSFAGLQVILQAIVCGDVLIAAVGLNIKENAALANHQQVNAISATPSYFRTLLMAWQEKKPPLNLISLGGEITDQATIDAITTTFPQATLRHIYATTESGVIFSVKDQKAGFPSQWLQDTLCGWQLSIVGHCLRLTNKEQSIDTGDLVEQCSERVYFIGRQDNIVNVGGEKVNLEQLEQQIFAQPHIDEVRVFAKRNPISGYLVCAEIQSDNELLARESLLAFSNRLTPAQRPRIISFTNQITLSQTGKKQRV
ncbi:MAG: AMP-binding protein [Psychrobium sp.]|nr:AMP-binding protein [Psychrobium sp.]